MFLGMHCPGSRLREFCLRSSAMNASKFERYTVSHILSKIIIEVADTVEVAKNACVKVDRIDRMIRRILKQGISISLFKQQTH